MIVKRSEQYQRLAQESDYLPLNYPPKFARRIKGVAGVIVKITVRFYKSTLTVPV
jgi:hypothetical protein